MGYEEAMEQTNEELKQLIAAGKRVIGYIYPHTPIEIILGHGLTPSLVGTSPGVTGAFEASLQTFTCAFARNLFSQRVNDQLPAITGLIFPGNTCDSLQNVADVWRIRFPDDNVFRLTYPVADQSEAAVQYFAEEIRILSKTLEETFGQPFNENEYDAAVTLVSAFREAAQFLYASRVLDPQSITYANLAGLVRGFLLSPELGSLSEIEAIVHNVQQHLMEKGLLQDAKKLQKAILKGNLEKVEISSDLTSLRIAVAGGMVEPQAIANLLDSIPEVTDDVMVIDILSFGFRTVFTPQPSPPGNCFEQTARSILNAPTEPTQEGLPRRVEFLKSMLTKLSIDGLIICEQSFCDPDQFEAPSLEAAASEVNVPSVRLPLDPELSDRARLEVRIQSFLETLHST